MMCEVERAVAVVGGGANMEWGRQGVDGAEKEAVMWVR